MVGDVQRLPGRVRRADEADTSPYTDADYFAHVDGKPRYDGVRDFLSSRGIALPEGSPPTRRPPSPSGASATARTTPSTRCWSGTAPAPTRARSACWTTSVTWTLPLAVVSSSANAPAVLAAARLADRFVTVVDGQVAGELGLAGKPAPDMFLHAARDVRGHPDRAVVVEDAVSGVQRRRGRWLRSGDRGRPWGGGRHPHRRGCRPGGRRPRRPAVSPGNVPRRPAGPEPLPDRRVAPGRVRGPVAGPRRDRDPVHRRQRLPRDARQPRGGPGGPRPRHVHQRLPRDVADPPRGVGLRLRAHRPDPRQRARRQADEALRRRRAADPRHGGPRALRAEPRLPGRDPASHPDLAYAGRQAGARRLDADGLDDPAAPRRADPRGDDAARAARRS